MLLFALAALNLPYYTFFLQRRGVWFVSRVFPVHLLHHLCNGFSFVAGSAVHYATSRTLLQLPGALPVTRWPPSEYSGGRR